MKTGFAWHERFMWHEPGPSLGVLPSLGDSQPGTHLYNPETMRKIKNMMDAYSITEELHTVRIRAASDETLLRFHTEDYLRHVSASSAGRGGSELGEACPAGPQTDAIARLAVGATCSVLEATLKGELDNAYALTRPAGHHAERNRGMGMCVYGNVALAIMEARAKKLVDRVAIIDWDVHHGNGTQQAFYSSKDVLMISIHEETLYPLDTGKIEEQGENEGLGYNINVPLPAGSGGGAYLAAMERIVQPALQLFKPECIIVSSGLDASYFDAMGHMLLVSTHYRAMTKMVMEMSRSLCGGKLIVVQEGGYSDFYLPFCAVAIVEELAGIAPRVADPYALYDSVDNQALRPHQSAYIEAAVNGPLSTLAKVC